MQVKLHRARDIGDRDPEHGRNGKKLRRVGSGPRATHGVGMSEHEPHRLTHTASAKVASGPTNLFEAIRRRIVLLGGIELEIAQRRPVREPPRFED
jgi:hypothetical protein